MALWLKATLWIAVVLLPGGLLLVPVLLAFHRRNRGDRAPAEASGAAGAAGGAPARDE